MTVFTIVCTKQTFILSNVLLCGPFHRCRVSPQSNKNTSPWFKDEEEHLT